MHNSYCTVLGSGQIGFTKWHLDWSLLETQKCGFGQQFNYHDPGVCQKKKVIRPGIFTQVVGEKYWHSVVRHKITNSTWKLWNYLMSWWETVTVQIGTADCIFIDAFWKLFTLTYLHVSDFSDFSFATTIIFSLILSESHLFSLQNNKNNQPLNL